MFAPWVEYLPEWVELYPEWIEGLSTPQWIACGWAEFNPQWIDGPECPYTPEVTRLGAGWDVHPAKRATNQKIKEDDEITLQILLRCVTMMLGNVYEGEIPRVIRSEMQMRETPR